MSKISKILYLVIATLFFVLFNRYVSLAILNSAYQLASNPILDLVFVQNTGAAFSLLEGSKWFLIIFSAVSIIGILFYSIKHIKSVSLISIFWTSLLLAGIFCNLYERMTLGYVQDFFKLNFINFPVFNISDMFINISVLAIVIIIIKHNFKKNNEADN